MVRCSAWFEALPACAGPPCQELGGCPAPLRRLCYRRRPVSMPVPFLVQRALRSARWFDWAGERFRPTRLVTAARLVLPGRGRSRWDGWCLCRLPRRMSVGNASPRSRSIPVRDFAAAAAMRAGPPGAAHQPLLSAPNENHRPAAFFQKRLSGFDLTILHSVWPN